jgi:Domain of unknown function (DUF1992)
VTERKPPGTSFTTWIDQQILEAEQRGAFDNLPGAGKPLPNRREDTDYGQAWLRDYARREGVAEEELLPAPLKLRRQSERLIETVHTLDSEQEVRDAAADLNAQIKEWRRIPVGPPIPVPLLDAEMLVTRWRDARLAPPPPPAPGWARTPGSSSEAAPPHLVAPPPPPTRLATPTATDGTYSPKADISPTDTDRRTVNAENRCYTEEKCQKPAPFVPSSTEVPPY